MPTRAEVQAERKRRMAEAAAAPPLSQEVAPEGAALSGVDPAAPAAPAPAPAPAPATADPGPALPPSADEPEQAALDDAGTMDLKEIGTQSAELAKGEAKADPEKAKQLNAELEKMTGGASIDDIFEGFLERLGGKSRVGTYKLSREEKGMFMMDFGLRMMAHSENKSFGGAIGQAGAETIQSARGYVDEREEMLRKEDTLDQQRALAMTKEQINPRQNVWARGGLFNTLQGDYVRDQQGEPVRPGMLPGAANRITDKRWLHQRIRDMGFEDGAALAMTMGAMHPAEFISEERTRIYDEIAAGKGTFLAGRRLRNSDITAMRESGELNALIEQHLQQAESQYLDWLTTQYQQRQPPPRAGGGPALQQDPNPAPPQDTGGGLSPGAQRFLDMTGGT